MDGQSAQPGITIKKLTRSEAEAWEASHRGEEPAELASLDLDHSIAAAPDELTNLVALDGDRPVGKIAMAPCRLVLNGREVDGIVTTGLYVAPAYRPMGIGSVLMLAVMGLKQNWVFGNPTPELLPLLLRWRRLRRIDANPISYLPLSLRGLVKVAGIYAKRRIYRNRPSELAGPGPLAASRALTGLRRRPASANGFHIQRGEGIIERLRALLETPVRPCQIPHSMERLESALSGERHRYRNLNS